MGSSFPLTFIFFKMVIAPPTSDYKMGEFPGNHVWWHQRLFPWKHPPTSVASTPVNRRKIPWKCHMFGEDLPVLDLHLRETHHPGGRNSTRNSNAIGTLGRWELGNLHEPRSKYKYIYIYDIWIYMVDIYIYITLNICIVAMHIYIYICAITYIYIYI